jgi:hypothetical protein
MVAKNIYIVRHDKVCTHLRHSINEKLSVSTAENWYLHIPKAVCEHEDITGYGIKRCREVLDNRLGVIIKNKTQNLLNDRRTHNIE